MDKESAGDGKIQVAAEDRFLIFDFGCGECLAPQPDDSQRLGDMLDNIYQQLSLIPVFDLRDLPGYYSDIDEFIKCVRQESSYALLDDRQSGDVWQQVIDVQRLVPVHIEDKLFSTRQLDQRYFDANATHYFEPAYERLANDLPTLDEGIQTTQFPVRIGNEEIIPDTHQYQQTFPEYVHPIHHIDIDFSREREFYENSIELSLELQQRDLLKLIRGIHSHSLLIEVVMSVENNGIVVSPYHAHAVHQVETRTGQVILGRPARIAETTGAIFSQEHRDFEVLINNQFTSEHDIQQFLVNHPNFLHGLNYENIYPQLVLQRDVGDSLIPDFFLEPFDDAFCDILDVKLPVERIIVGRKDRATLAAALHQVAAQLREYAAYFEEEKHRDFVRQKYGLNVYRPRLIALVGRDLRQTHDEEIRRALTTYENLQFMTFDELLRHAKRRILL